MSWTEERVATLKKLWGEGKTAAEIAKELGGVTRNAVIGKAHRLKLSNRLSPIQQTAKKSATSAASKPKTEDKKAAISASAAASQPKKKMPKPANMDIPFTGKGVKLADLKEKMCRWPIGDPQEADFKFCGCANTPGLPYCEEHARLAYQTTSRSRKLREDDFANIDSNVKAAG